MKQSRGLPTHPERPEEPAASKELVLFRLNRLAAVTGQPLTRLCEGRYGITRREWRIIVTLARKGPLLSTLLAEKARIEPALTSRAVTLLVGKGLAVRHPRKNDRRYVDIHLTEKGVDIFESLYPSVVEFNERLLSVLSDSDRSALDQILGRLEQHAEGWLTSVDLPKTDRRRLSRLRPTHGG